LRGCVRTRKGNRRSLHYATPDFLLSLVALAILMRLSLTKAAYVAMSSAALQKIRVRSGRDHKVVAGKYQIFHGESSPTFVATLSSRPERSVVEGSAVSLSSSHTPSQAPRSNCIRVID
jgi:hypothetical protein